MRLSRPVYEALPYVYMLVGIAALAASFLFRFPRWSDMLAVFGLVAAVIGLMLVLKRRDYRIQKRRYGGAFDDDDDR
jgi:hypothetical protein